MTTFKSKADILAEIKIAEHAIINNYKIVKNKSSTTWLKLHNENNGDTIMVNVKKNLYYNLDYDLDKGDIIQFVANRLHGTLSIDKSKEAFYQALVSINKDLGNYLKKENIDLLSKKDSFILRKEKLSQIQNANWNEVPIIDYKFLCQKRAISIDVLQSDYFKGRLYNTYMQQSNGHVVTNTGFPKYINNEIVGMEVKNVGYSNILGDHNGIFVTNTDSMKTIDAIFYAESVIDIASAIEILQANPNFNKTKNYCFLSFSGNLYESKMNVILQQIEQLPTTGNTLFVSLTDTDNLKKENEKVGKQYDLQFTAALINKKITPLEFSKDSTFAIYNFLDKKTIDVSKIRQYVEEHNSKIDELPINESKFGKYIVIKETDDELKLHLPLIINLEDLKYDRLLKILNADKLYRPLKPKTDWNTKYIEEEIKQGIRKNTITENLQEEIKIITSKPDYKKNISKDWNDELQNKKNFINFQQKTKINTEKKTELDNPKTKKNAIRR